MLLKEKECEGKSISSFNTDGWDVPNGATGLMFEHCMPFIPKRKKNDTANMKASFYEDIEPIGKRDC